MRGTVQKSQEYHSWLADSKPRFSCSDVADFIGKYDEFAVFGAGQGGLILKQRLEKKGKKVVCFLDTDHKKKGTVVAGCPVYHPSVFDFSNRKILIGSSWSAQISRQLVAEHQQQPIRDFVPLYSLFCASDRLMYNRV